MGHLFLDIETYASESNPDSALSPYLPESKVLVIAYNYYPGFRPPAKAEIKPPVFLKEWEFGEKSMLASFLQALRSIWQKDPHMKLHGFNILKFDLPYLFGRMAFHGLAQEHELHNILFRPFSIDMMQLSSLISDASREKEQLWGISQSKANEFFGIQVKEGSGIDCSRFYDRREYEKIMDYCRKEFTFEQLMNAFYLYAQGLKEGHG